jgi:hypothetical protein
MRGSEIRRGRGRATGRERDHNEPRAKAHEAIIARRGLR